MPSSKFTYAQPSGAPSRVVREEQIEYGFIGKLQGLKYDYRADIRDRAALERNFREKFEALKNPPKGPRPGRTGADGRPGAPAHQTRPGARHFRVECV